MQKKSVLSLTLAILTACQGGKELAKIAQKQVVIIKPNPLELHGGQVKADLSINLPSELAQKEFQYEGQILFVNKEFTSEILRIPTTKNTLKKDTTFAFQYVPNQTEYGEVTIKAKITQKGSVYETSPINIGRGVLTTALLFQENPAPGPAFYPFQKQEPTNDEVVILFEEKSAELSEAEKAKLKNIQQSVKIIGYFSPEGNENENFALAQRRANNVRDFLGSQKVSVSLQNLSLQEWKNFLQTFVDESTKKQVASATSATQIHTILKNAEKTDFYPSMRAVRILPANAQNQTTSTTTTNNKNAQDTTQWIAMWEKEIEKNPSAEAHHQVGTWYARQFLKSKDEASYQKATENLQKAINLGGKGESYYNYAYLLKQKGQQTQADTLLKQSLQKGYTDTLLSQWINQWQGLQKARQATSAKDKKYAEALNHFENAGKNTKSIFNQALTNLLTYQYDKAAQLLEKIQDFSLALYVRAIVGMRKGNQQEALTWLQKAFEKDQNLKAKAQKDMEFWEIRDNDLLK